MIGFYNQTHRCSHLLQSRRFQVRTGRSVARWRWFYTDTDPRPSHTRRWWSPEGHTDRLNTRQTENTPLINKRSVTFRTCKPDSPVPTYAKSRREWWTRCCRWAWSTFQPELASAWSERNPDTCSGSCLPGAALPLGRYHGNQEAPCI